MLDEASIAAITQEARICFLQEDAPDYLILFEEGLGQLREAYSSPNPDLEMLGETFKELGRSAHSLKGGSGMAQLPSLNALSHKIEDLLQALENNRVREELTAVELLTLAYEEVCDLIENAIAEREDLAHPSEISLVLDEFMTTLDAEEMQGMDLLKRTDSKSGFIKTSLEVDLEDCLKRVEKVSKSAHPAQELQQILNVLIEECNLLGQALQLSWLTEIAQVSQNILEHGKVPLPKLAKIAIADIRRLRTEALDSNNKKPLKLSPTLRNLVPSPQSPASPAPEKPVTTQTPKTTKISPQLNLRIPVKQLNQMSDTVGELIITHEQLVLYEVQLQRANNNLKKRTQQLDPLRDQVQSLYDQFATTDLASNSRLKDENSEETDLFQEFDPLQFDQYTAVHSTLQKFQELMVQVQETREDIALVSRDLQEALVQLRQQLDSLHEDLTESRLVRFGSIAARFVGPLATLSQRHNKEVTLKIVGEDVLVDQAVLEQLQTPLTHLLRNAFDHGIEMPHERVKQRKPTMATITLSAKVRGNQVMLTITDDGRGINLKKVYQSALKKGICSRDTTFEQLNREQILNFIFTPGFSTAANITSLSGRGMGLDIVRLEVERMRGSLTVESNLGKGSQFKIRIPLTLNILPLLLCRTQQQAFAFPSANVRELLELANLYIDWSYHDRLPTVEWQRKKLPIYPLDKLFSHHQPLSSSQFLLPKSGIIVDVNGKLIVIASDAVLGERELVLKSFDNSVPVPPYIAGCTVLGTGEIVPILSPDYFEELLTQVEKELVGSDRKLIEVAEPLISEQISILIVDDSIAVRRSLTRTLIAGGYQVVQGRDGKEALHILEQPEQNFGLILCDIEMPVLDGFSLLQIVRKHPRWHKLPVAMLTSRESDLHRNKAMSLGATAYFTKPFYPVELLAAIAELLAVSNPGV